MLSLKRDHYRKKIREVDKRIASLADEIRRLETLLSERTRKKEPILKHSLKKELPESERRLVSYLSTGSFQTIDLRRHERRAAKIKRAVFAAIIAVLILIVWIWFRG